MGRVANIFKKEFKAYFVSPIAYIVISIFLLVTGWFFFSTFFVYSQATLRNFFALYRQRRSGPNRVGTSQRPERRSVSRVSTRSSSSRSIPRQ